MHADYKGDGLSVPFLSLAAKRRLARVLGLSVPVRVHDWCLDIGMSRESARYRMRASCPGPFSAAVLSTCVYFYDLWAVRRDGPAPVYPGRPLPLLEDRPFVEAARAR